ncbi:MAG: hypothetical protein ACKOPQ_00210 [Novosphingobium sp.]
MTSALLQLGVSLLAVLAVSGFTVWLGLGGDVRLRSEAQARTIAELAVTGFDPVEVSIDRAGIGALLRDSQDRVMLIRRHGVHFAARLLPGFDGARLDRNLLTLSTGEATFGAVTLDLGPQAQAWAASLRRIGGQR